MSRDREREREREREGERVREREVGGRERRRFVWDISWVSVLPSGRCDRTLEVSIPFRTIQRRHMRWQAQSARMNPGEDVAWSETVASFCWPSDAAFSVE